MIEPSRLPRELQLTNQLTASHDQHAVRRFVGGIIQAALKIIRERYLVMLRQERECPRMVTGIADNDPRVGIDLP